MRPKHVIISILCFCASFLQAQGAMHDALNAAKSGYAAYLDKIPLGQEKQFGFENRADFKKAKLGKAYRIVSMSKDFYEKPYITGTDYLVTRDEFRIPLMVNGVNRVLITVAKMKGKWEVVNIGSAEMAKELGELEKKYPSAADQGKILVVTGIKGDFLLNTKPQSKSLLACPFASARAALEWKSAESSRPLNELLPSIKTISDKNKQSNR